jgi:3-deoxy-D-manno-octulosonate 8-phosphate phosphatase (KDO 8-P phosphatase)
MNGEITTVEYNLNQAHTLKNNLEQFRRIKTFIFDVDGVMTDGKLIVTEGGEFLRTFHTQDGYAIRRAIEEGYNVCIITGGSGNSIEARMKILGIRHYYTGISNKLPIFKRFVESHGLNTDEILYMGDDLNDYEVLKNVGLPCCPANACPEIMALAHYISPKTGGECCVRDVIEKVMKLHGNWMNHLTISG